MIRCSACFMAGQTPMRDGDLLTAMCEKIWDDSCLGPPSEEFTQWRKLAVLQNHQIWVLISPA